MLFVKAAKLFAASLALAPLTGCAMATGAVFGKFFVATSKAPDSRNFFFANTLLAFAFIRLSVSSLRVVAFLLLF